MTKNTGILKNVLIKTAGSMRYPPSKSYSQYKVYE